MKKDSKYGLNEKQIRFCREFVIDSNKTQAAIRAGYSEKTASALGERLFRKVEVQNLINELKKDIEKATSISAQKVINELGYIAFANILDYMTVTDGEKKGENIITLTDWKELTREQGAAIESIQKTRDGYKIKLYNKPHALELLGNHFALFSNDKSQLSDQEIEKLRMMIYSAMEENI